MKKVTLNKRWKEIVFAAAGFGPNLLMVLMTAYLSDALIPKAVRSSSFFYTYGDISHILVLSFIFPVLWFLCKLFDGVIDVPLGAWTDKLQNKTGNRFIALTIAFVPMLVSYVLTWIPVFGNSANLETWRQAGNTVWILFWALVFFASYTLGLITFYGSLTDVCENQTQRSRVSLYKSIFDTITYALGYAAIPGIFGSIMPIWKVAIVLSPLMVTILIPLLLGNKKFDPNSVDKSGDVPFGKSISLTFKSKPFMKWIIVYCFSFFGLQLFLAAQNTIISGVINFQNLTANPQSSGTIGQLILNTAAFAPVPLFLVLFNKIRRNKGIRFAFQTALIAFGVGILMLGFAGDYFWHENNTAKLIIGLLGSIIGSWGIGAFFMVPYLIPSTISSVEAEVTGKNHGAMYFGVQALFSTAAGALSSTLLYDLLKQWVQNPDALEHPEKFETGYELAQATGLTYGASMVPGIVFISCIVAFLVSFIMPKKYTASVIYQDLKDTATKKYDRLKIKQDKIQYRIDAKIARINSSSRDDEWKKMMKEKVNNSYSLKLKKIKQVMAEPLKVINMKFDESKSRSNEEKDVIEKSSTFGTIALYFLTFGISNIVTYFADIRKLKILGIKTKTSDKVLIILSIFIPFVSIYTAIYFANKIDEYSKSKKLNIKTHKFISILTSILLPCFTNIFELVIRENCFNKISESLD